MRNVRSWPVKTNAAFLYQVLNDPDFIAGDVDTGLIARKGEAWTALVKPSAQALQAAAAAYIRSDFASPHTTGADATPWTMTGFRLNANSKPRSTHGSSGG